MGRDAMSSSGPKDVGRDLDRLFRNGSLAGMSDVRLLERFVGDGDAEAFEALVARHREMLLRTCYDLLGDAADAEEAFQSTVVILLRRGRSIREKHALGGWLHRVACRVARRLRAEAARRRSREGRAMAMRMRQPVYHPDPLVQEELRIALQEEIDRLPDRYRRPVIACLLEGMTLERAAARLGWTEGSVRGRLARGRARLRDRLTRRGIGLAAVLTALGESGPAAAAEPFAATLRAKAVGVAVTTLLAVGGVALAFAVLAERPQQSAAMGPSAQHSPAPTQEHTPNSEPERETLAAFRGGGPTNEARATALAPDVAARQVRFEGRVLDPSGNGVPGARLSLITDAWSLPEPQALSGNDGSFLFTRTVGDFWRNFAKGGIATPLVQAVVLATHDSFGAAWVNLKVVAKDGTPAFGGEYPLTLRMVPDRPIVGRLLDDKGRPIVGAVVRVEQLYAVPRGDLSPLVDALRRFDLEPYQTTYPRIWPNNLAAPMAIPPVTTAADGRFRLTGVGRDRQANLLAIGPGMAPTKWTVLNRDDAIEVTKAVRARWPHQPKKYSQQVSKAAAGGGTGVEVYGPTFELQVDPANTVSGFVRDATTGQPVKGAMVYTVSSNLSTSGATSDDQGYYRIIRQDEQNHFWIVARPKEGSILLGAAREHKTLSSSGEITADFALPRAVVVSGRVVERGTGRPMLATRHEGCHGPGPIMGGRLWYRPLAGNAAASGNEFEGYMRHGVTDQLGLFVGLVEDDGRFRAVVPPGPGVLLLEAAPGMPFMWQFSMPTKEGDELHRRFPYAPLRYREPADGAPRVAGAPENTLPGAYGPIPLDSMVAYRVIEPAADRLSYDVQITIPAARTRRVRFVDPEGRPVRGAIVVGLTSSASHQVMLEGDETDVIGLDPTGERRLTALGPDGRLAVETTIRADAPEPIVVRMRRSAAVSGKLIDEKSTAVSGASSAVSYGREDPFAIPLPRNAAKTDVDGRFLVEGMLPGHAVTIEFYRAGSQSFPSEHFRPQALRELILDDKAPRDAGSVRARSSPW
jgi:RNA polymerase sigma factor (sigma-70 family)